MLPCCVVAFLLPEEEEEPGEELGSCLHAALATTLLTLRPGSCPLARNAAARSLLFSFFPTCHRAWGANQRPRLARAEQSEWTLAAPTPGSSETCQSHDP